MSSPETRTLYQQRTYSDEGDTDSNWPWKMIDQLPIPWCTTHDIQAFSDSDLCWLEEGLGPEPVGCVVSRGGPDHKWWRDV